MNLLNKSEISNAFLTLEGVKTQNRCPDVKLSKCIFIGNY